MNATKKAIWIWSEGNPKDIIKKDYIEAGEKCKDIGDFSKFKTRDELRKAIYELKGWAENRLSIAYWQIMHDVAIGDIIVINNNVSVKGNKYQHNLYGWGEVVSNCEYTTEGDNRIKRKVKWHHPLLANPVIADKMTNNIFFHKTTPEEAEQVKEVLFTNSKNITMDNRLKYYIDLLKANHNVIFNGAPGTGKTFLANKIAEEMGATCKMVQFHPSYDYTDFVEGLRPIKDEKGNIGFERKDGVFKEFCSEAIVKYDKYTTEEIEHALDQFRKEMDGKNITSYKNSKNEFGVRIDGDLIKIIPMNKLADYNGSLHLPTINIQKVINFIHQGYSHNSYEPTVGKYLLDHYLPPRNEEGQNNKCNDSIRCQIQVCRGKRRLSSNDYLSIY